MTISFTDTKSSMQQKPFRVKKKTGGVLFPPLALKLGQHNLFFKFTHDLVVSILS
jgi:hypothetical protein